MDLIKTKKVLKKTLRKFNKKLDFKIEVEEQCVKATNNITINGYDDDILVSLEFYSGGCAYFEFYFDYLDKTGSTLNLINDFNDNVLHLKASITQKGCLHICHTVQYLTEKTLPECTFRVLGSLTEDNTKKYLQPLTAITVSR